MIRIRPAPRLLAMRYLPSIWDSPLIRAQIESTARTTAGIHKINQNDLETLQMPLPPLLEQVRIVDEVERLSTLIDQMEATVEVSLKRAKSLRQAILRQAFSGELTFAISGDVT